MRSRGIQVDIRDWTDKFGKHFLSYILYFYIRNWDPKKNQQNGDNLGILSCTLWFSHSRTSSDKTRPLGRTFMVSRKKNKQSGKILLSLQQKSPTSAFSTLSRASANPFISPSFSLSFHSFWNILFVWSEEIFFERERLQNLHFLLTWGSPLSTQRPLPCLWEFWCLHHSHRD